MRIAEGKNGLMFSSAGSLVMVRHAAIGLSMRSTMLVLKNPAIRLQSDMKHRGDPCRHKDKCENDSAARHLFHRNTATPTNQAFSPYCAGFIHLDLEVRRVRGATKRSARHHARRTLRPG